MTVKINPLRLVRMRYEALVHGRWEPVRLVVDYRRGKDGKYTAYHCYWSGTIGFGSVAWQRKLREGTARQYVSTDRRDAA